MSELRILSTRTSSGWDYTRVSYLSGDDEYWANLCKDRVRYAGSLQSALALKIANDGHDLDLTSLMLGDSKPEEDLWRTIESNFDEPV